MPSTIPLASLNQVNAEAEFHIVECAYPQPGTSLFAFETAPLDPERAASRRNIIEDIATGQIERVHKVWHASTSEPLRDVSKDIAEDVAKYLREDHADEVKGCLRDFLEEHLGVYAVERYVGARAA